MTATLKPYGERPRPTPDEARVLMRLCIGRLFLLAARPTQPGDDEQYDHLRRVARDCAEVLGISNETYQLLPPGLAGRT